jgi:hypothetical protein
VIESDRMEKDRPLTWFAIVNLALLFISGCWMIGSLMVTSWKSSLGFARPLLLTGTALANISFLASMLASILGAANIIKETPARRVTVYVFTVGILLLIISIITFCWIVVSTSPYSSFD